MNLLDSDLATCRLLAQRDPEGVRTLLQSHARTVADLLRREFAAHLDADDIDDLLNQASERGWRSSARSAFRTGMLRAWFLAIARNCARRMLAVRRRQPPLVLLGDLDVFPEHAPDRPSTESGPSQPISLLSAVLTCIDELSLLRRAILLADLAAGGTVPAAELASRLGTKPEAVIVARAKGRKQLYQMLRARGHLLDRGEAAS